MKTFIVNVNEVKIPIVQDDDGKFLIPKELRGLGSALKPAWEPIVLARKPISEKTVAKNVLRWNCGGLNIDGCRVELVLDKNDLRLNAKNHKHHYSNPSSLGLHNSIEEEIKNCDLGRHNSQGRFPSNVVFSHTVFCTDDSCHETCAVRMLDEQSGECKSGGPSKNRGFQNKYVGGKVDVVVDSEYKKDKGTGASRFFYCSKVSPSERGDSTHVTMKSLKLMSYLCRLVTPPNGVVLDPFMGSGSTGVAALKEGFGFVGIEKEEEYFKFAEGRINKSGKLSEDK